MSITQMAPYNYFKKATSALRTSQVSHIERKTQAFDVQLTLTHTIVKLDVSHTLTLYGANRSKQQSSELHPQHNFGYINYYYYTNKLI